MLGPEHAETFSRCIAVGGVAVFPADTVYGLACDADTPDAVLSNPPYVRAGDRLPADVADHEPHVALFADGDGLAVVRRLAPAAAQAGAAMLALEVGEGQAGAVTFLVRAAGFPDVAVVPDYAGIDRIVVGRR